MLLTSNSAEVGSSIEMLSDAVFTGGHLEISCNGRYVFEALESPETRGDHRAALRRDEAIYDSVIGKKTA